MITTEDLDKDVETLHDALDPRTAGRVRRCGRRCRVAYGFLGLVLVMFLFGMITRPDRGLPILEEVPVSLDGRAPLASKQEIDARMAELHTKALSGGASVPTKVSTATMPRILSWTPDALTRAGGNGTPVPVRGTYEIPQGWFGAIRVIADGEEIGVTYVDARSLGSAGEGTFFIDHPIVSGQPLVRLAFDAVNGCRIICAPDDQLCMATNVNSCTALSDNQSFARYLPSRAKSAPSAGSCVEKVFVSGPKYAPQIPEDYTMCEKGMWNEDPSATVFTWMFAEKSIPTEDRKALLTELAKNHRQQKTPTIKGSSNDLRWEITNTVGAPEKQTACESKVAVSYRCEE